MNQNILLYIVIAILWLAYLAITVYNIYIRCLALEKLQEISFWRSFIAIYILGNAAQIMTVVFIEIILIGIGLFLVMM